MKKSKEKAHDINRNIYNKKISVKPMDFFKNSVIIKRLLRVHI